jgi:hypothetical protein
MSKLLICLTFTIVFTTQAQQKIRRLEVNDTIVFAAVDRPGDLYLITKDGQIQKFDKDGKLIIVYKHNTVPTLFEPRDGSRLFAYYREHQEYDYFNPSFDITGSFRIDPAFAIQPWLISTAGENKLWILDAADQSLKKINRKESEVELEVVIDSSVIQNAKAFTSIREYQGFVFLLDPHKGIYIFNNLGKHIKTIEVPGLHNFNFLGEELYYIKNHQVQFLDLFTGEGRSIAEEKACNSILLTDERQFLIGFKTIDITAYKP